MKGIEAGTTGHVLKRTRTLRLVECDVSRLVFGLHDDVLAHLARVRGVRDTKLVPTRLVDAHAQRRGVRSSVRGELVDAAPRITPHQPRRRQPLGMEVEVQLGWSIQMNRRRLA